MTSIDSRKPEFPRPLEGRRIAVIGASSGIGAATARVLSEAGARLVLTSTERSRETLEKRAEQLDARALAFDVTNESERRANVQRVWDILDGLDGWVHFAGADTLTGQNASLSFDDKLRLLWNVDVAGTIGACREAGRLMKAGAGGTIVTMGWDQAETGMEGDSGQLFAATKGAVMAFTKSLAVDLAPTVRVNAVAPGWIKTKWGKNASSEWHERAAREAPLARWGTPDDVARVTRFLLSDDAAFLTGQILRVGGGAVR